METISIEEFRSQINPNWRYNIIDQDGNEVFTGLDQINKQERALTMHGMNGLISKNPGMSEANVTVWAPNGSYESRGERMMRYRQKNNILVTIADEKEEQPTEETETKPTKGPVAQSTAPVLSGPDAVFANAPSAKFFYDIVAKERDTFKSKVESQETKIEALNEKIRKYELAELEHKQDLREKDEIIKDKEDEIKQAKGWSEKLNGLLDMAKTNPEGTQAMMSGIAKTFREQFGPKSAAALSGPNDRHLSEIIQWYNALPTEEHKQLVFQVINGLALSGDNMMQAATDVIDLLPKPQQTHETA